MGRWTLSVVWFYYAEAPPLLHAGRNLITPFTRVLLFEFLSQLAFCGAGVESLSCSDDIQLHGVPPANTFHIYRGTIQFYSSSNLGAT